MDLNDPAKRAEIVRQLKQVEEDRKKEAWERAAKLGIPTQVTTPDGGRFELQYFEGDKPIYHVPKNVNAAISTAASQVRGTAPFNVTGTGVTIGLWEAGGGIPRLTHQEFGSRISVRDGATTVTDHATHVAGTLAATGLNPLVKGMAPTARIDAYDSTSDISEMTASGASSPGVGGLYLSNHSYGFIEGWGDPENGVYTWYGKFTDNGNPADDIEDDFGRYSSATAAYDGLCYNLAYYLPVFSAGNDRNDGPPTGASWKVNGSSTIRVYDPSRHPAGDGLYKSGFDTLGGTAVAKNLLVVGAVTDAVNGGSRSVASANLTTFSSTGPTDDGRIKPDIVANGDQLLSTGSASDTATFFDSGTSMAAPNVTGSAALLVEYFGTRFPGYAMRASTLKGLIIHTADDMGNPGPDYRYGWGLMNTKAAADLIKRFADTVATPGNRGMVEGRLTTTTTSANYTYQWNGTDPIRVTLCWTDPAGTATSLNDDRARRLVNDLNVRLTGPTGTVYLPYVMPYVGNWTAAKLDAVATTGVNNVDNVEQVYVAAPGVQGTYTVTVDYAGPLTNGAQDYSLIVSGQLDAAPVNDTFSNRSVLTGVSATVVGGNVNATAEAGEPTHAGVVGGKSVWWTWTAPANGTVTISTAGSSFDTLLAVYKGTSIGGLTSVASDDESGTSHTSSLSFFATSGTTYAIAVDGSHGATGGILLSLALASTTDLYFTDFESFPSGNDLLAGRDGWASSDSTNGLSGTFQGFTNSRTAFLGFNPTSSASVLVWRPLGYDVIAAGTPVIQFKTDVSVIASTNGRSDDFYFDIYNFEGLSVARIDFDNVDHKIYRYDGTSFQPVGSFANGVRYALVTTMDFAANRWSATLGGAPLFTNQPMTAQSRSMTLGGIDAGWLVTTPGSSGNNYLVFDNFRVGLPATNTAPTISDIGNVTVNEDNAAVLAFSVADAETTAGSLIVTGSSSNLALIPNTSIVFGGSGGNRTVTITPAANQSGTATITVTVSDGTFAASDSFVVTVNAVNDAPTISDIPNQTIAEDSTTGPLAFTIADLETAAGSLALTGSSSNPALVPNSNIVFGGAGSNRTVTVMPAPNQNGTTTITVTVSDGQLTSSDSFVLTVNAVNDPPTISDIANQAINAGSSTAALAFTVADVDTAVGSLVVTGSSSNQTLVPNANIVFGGSGGNRTVTVTPVAGQGGTATITVTVSDGALTASDTFVLTVNAPPTITDIPNQVIDEDTPTAVLSFTVADAETAASNLNVTASCSNLALIPNSGIVLGGTGANRTLRITPAPNESGMATITVTVSDSQLTASDSFVVTVNAVNDPPTISNIGSQVITVGSSTGAVPFVVGDVETAASSLVVTATSSNQTLVPGANVVLGGSGTNRTITVTPTAGQFGSATITVTVSDGALSSSDTFVVSVQPAGLSATHAVIGPGYLGGSTVTITNTLTFTGTATGLAWHVLLPAGWTYISGAGSEGDSKPAVGTADLLDWSWSIVPASPVTFTYTLQVPPEVTGEKELAAMVDFHQSASAYQLLATPDPLVVHQVTTHSADTNHDFKLSLTELLRVIELYNTRNGSVRTGAYAVDPANTEDGFATDPARSNTAAVTLARYHAGDSNHDGKLSLTELLRVIELYNFRNGSVRTGQYHVQAGSEDGFATGP